MDKLQRKLTLQTAHLYQLSKRYQNPELQTAAIADYNPSTTILEDCEFVGRLKLVLSRLESIPQGKVLENCYFTAMRFSTHLPNGFKFYYRLDKKRKKHENLEYIPTGTSEDICCDLEYFNKIVDLSNIQNGYLYIPKSPFFPVLDAFMYSSSILFGVRPPVVALFQVTQGRKHPIKNDKLYQHMKDIRAKLNVNTKRKITFILVWCVGWRDKVYHKEVLLNDPPEADPEGEETNIKTSSKDSQSKKSPIEPICKTRSRSKMEDKGSMKKKKMKQSGNLYLKQYYLKLNWQESRFRTVP